MIRELIHPVTGMPRVWGEGSRLKAEGLSVAAAARPSASPLAFSPQPSALLPQITQAAADSHAITQIWQPVSPERAKTILYMALQGDLQMQWELFSIMEDSWERLSKNLNEVKKAVKRLNWTVTPYAQRGEEPTPEAQEKADLVEDAMANWLPEVGTLEYDFEESLWNGLDAMSKGISVQEIHWQVLNGSILPRAAHLLTPRQYGWNASGTKLGLANSNQSGPPVQGIPRASASPVWQDFPKDQFVVGFWHARAGTPGATAMLRPLVPYWIGMTYGWRWLMQTAQLFGIPFRWATYDPNQPGLVNDVCAMLQNMGASGWAAFPQGTTLEFKEAVTNANGNPQVVLIEMAKKACDIMILGQELSGESAATGLGSGVAELQGEVRQEVLHHSAWWIADLYNYQLVPAILRLNYGDVIDPPVIAPDLAAGIDPKALADRDQVLVNMGMKIPEWWMYERHGIPEPQEGESVIEAPKQSVGTGPLPVDENSDGKGQVKGLDARTVKRPEGRAPVLAADAATEKLIDNTLEELTGVQARWLGGVKPFFRKLILAAGDDQVSDADFLHLVKASQREFPELFGKLDHEALAEALEAAMGAACVNGAVRGYMDRRLKAKGSRLKEAAATL